MNNYIITAISDTHTMHKALDKDLPGGNLLIHSGDLSSSGKPHEIENFCKWFDGLDRYDHKIFIAGNHDFLFENHSDDSAQIVNSYKWINYLQDSYISVGEEYDDMVKIYGSPWQPEFMNWAFNLPHNGPQLEKVWSLIPDDTDILVTHGPPYGKLDTVVHRSDENLGCRKLEYRIAQVKPKIHIFGHIHTGNGYYFDGHTHYINASVLDERYRYAHLPVTFDWDPVTNIIKIINNIS